MELRVSSPGTDLVDEDIDRIQKDLEKIDRRLNGLQDVFAEVRINDGGVAQGYQVILELEYRRNHLMAKATHTDMGQAVREAREDILRQINDRSRRGHSSFTKGR
ncbi:MAG TPA: HPF/RaiA family ribosome-associated protein [Actinomycetota bacterium]|jgi:ribosome-associated translation inhibitor RaiA|nr:HPF/RaiA family ribosome-associated protein [Actinomycetota bacterium]